MKNFKIVLLLILFNSINVISQNDFKGKIIYQVDFEIYNPNISKEVLFNEFGKEATFLYDNGKYFQTYVNGTTEFDIMDSKAQLYYRKFRNNDTLFITDATKRKDQTLLNTEEGFSEEVVLGKKCDYFQLNAHIDSVDQKYYLKFFFNKDISINGSQFKNIKKGFANITYGKLNSIPLKFEIGNELFKMVATATEIDENYMFNVERIIQEKLESFPIQNTN